MGKKIAIIAFVFGCILVGIYHPWFSFRGTLSSGDWPYLYTETIRMQSILQSPPFLWLEPYYRLTAKIGVDYLLLPWEAVERLFWFFPVLILSVCSSFIFIYSVFSHIPDRFTRALLAAMGMVIYVSNTYILMVVGGGQMGVAMAYGFAPLIFYFVKELFEKERWTFADNIGMTVVFSMQLMFDPRLFVITIGANVLYGICVLMKTKTIPKRSIVKRVLLVLVGSVVLNCFWIVPNMFSYTHAYQETVGDITLSFFSVATLSNSISLLHPNWPENLFGKVYFMRPQFLLFPILAFLPLLFLSRFKKYKFILPISLIGLIGAFFAKGVNPPFGQLYEWMALIPGFMIFRDPTKFYLLVSLSYSILLPMAVFSLAEYGIRYRHKAVGVTIVAILFLCYWCITIYPSLTGQLGGTFRLQSVPGEYIALKNYFFNETPHSTVWVPRHQRFGYYDSERRAIDSQVLFGDLPVDELKEVLQKNDSYTKLYEEEVRFVVVPYDSEKEMFLTDRVYDDSKRQQFIDLLDTVPWLQKISIPGVLHTAVYEVQDKSKQ
jgi:hypothetical protein